jgi:hypothetical protein
MVEYIEKNPHSDIYERWLTLYAKVDVEKNTGTHGPAYTTMGSPSTQRSIPKPEEEYLEKNPLSDIYEHGLTLYAKVGPQPGGRIHREKSTVRND